MTNSESIANLAKALVAAHAEMPAVPMDEKNPFLGNEFASLGSIIDTVRPVLAKHGLAVMQFACSDEHARVGVRTRLLHSSGEWLEDTIYMEVFEDKDSRKSKAQVAGSIITYLRRYSQSGILNLYADADTDGNSPGAVPSVPKAQPVSTQRQVAKTPTQPASAPAEAKSPNLAEKCKAKFLLNIAQKKWEIFAWDYAVQNGWIMPNERLEDASAEKFPKTAQEYDELMVKFECEAKKPMTQELMEAFDKVYLDVSEAHEPQPEFPTEQKDRPAWMAVKMHWGKMKGVPLGDLDRKYLYGLCMNWEPKPFRGQVSSDDVTLRKALDEAKAYHSFKESAK